MDEVTICDHIRFAIEQNNIAVQFQEIKDRLSEHDVQLNHIYDAIENLLDENVRKTGSLKNITRFPESANI